MEKIGKKIGNIERGEKVGGMIKTKTQMEGSGPFFYLVNDYYGPVNY